jgi:dTDP-4-amino-4,6-dideoxygalactose transaminase
VPHIKIKSDRTSVYAQYSIFVPPGHRDKIRAQLSEWGVSTAVYYPSLISNQIPFRERTTINFQNASEVVDTILAIPFGAYMEDFEIEYLFECFDALKKKVWI